MRHVPYLLLGVFLVALSIVIHEFGHLIAALALGVGVSEFSLGFGPLLAQFHRGIDWSIRAIPLGGYCALDISDFASWQTFTVLVSGVWVNFAAWLTFNRIANWRQEGPVSFDDPDWMRRIPWYYGGLIIRVLSGPLVAAWRMAVEMEEGRFFRVFGTFNLILGLVNILPILPFVDGSKLLAVVMMSLFGESDSAFVMWADIMPLLFLGALFLFTQHLRRSLYSRLSRGKDQLARLVSDLRARYDPLDWDVQSSIDGEQWEISVNAYGDTYVLRGSLYHVPPLNEVVSRFDMPFRVVPPA